MTTTQPHHLKEDLRREIDHTIADLQRIRDEMKVRMHLGAMEFADAATALDRDFLKLRDAAHDAQGDALVAIRTGLTQVGHGLTELGKKLDAAGKKS